MNNKIYSKSNAIVTISEGLKNIIGKYNNNIHVINNGIDMDINSLCQVKSNKNKFNIVYTGSLYSGKRDAELLFKVVSKLIKINKLEKIQLVYAGKDSDIWKYWVKKYNLEKYSLTYDLLITKEVKKIQLEASINLMLTWSTKNEKGILTGKFYEYLPYLKPIICIINGEKDIEIEKKFNSLGCGIVIYNNQTILFEYIKKYFIQWEKDKYIDIEYNKDELNKYTSIYLTEQLENILLKVDNK